MPVVLAVYHFYYSHLQLFQDKGRKKMQTGMRDSVNRLTALKSIDCIILLRFFENRTKQTRFKCAAEVKTELTAESSGAMAYEKILFHRFGMTRLRPNQSLRRPGDFQQSVVLSFLILN